MMVHRAGSFCAVAVGLLVSIMFGAKASACGGPLDVGWMVGGIRYEFTHRVIATCVGLLTIGLAAWLWKVEKRFWMRWLGWAALGGVIAQGILGGITVRMFQPPPVSAAHATLAQLFFSTFRRHSPC